MLCSIIPDDRPPKVCILAQARPYFWTSYYIEAFRERCDVVTVGPVVDEATLRSDGQEHLREALAQNDVICDFAQMDGLESLLPHGWTPDLVVGISGIGGAPLYARVAELPWPSAFLSIDTWQCLGDYAEARQYDVVFAAQRAFVPHLLAAGCRHVHWLPLAASPDHHFPVDSEETHDVSFVGMASQPIHRPRLRHLQALQQEFSVLRAEAVYGDEVCAQFAKGTLAFNHAVVDEVNMRIFEVMAMGRPLLSNRTSTASGVEDLFEDERHIILYDSPEDLLDKTRRYLADETARRGIAQAGRKEVLAKHTYAHRVQTLLDVMATTLAKPERCAVTGPDGDTPWPLPEDAEYDRIILADPLALGSDLGGLLEACHAQLPCGGIVEMSLRKTSLPQGVTWTKPVAIAWLRGCGFHLHTFADEGEAFRITARKRTRKLLDIVMGVFEELKPSGIDIEAVRHAIPPDL